MIQRNVNGLVGNWCGSGVHPRPFPWPWGPLLRGTEPLEPIELIVAGAQFQKAAPSRDLRGCCRPSFQDGFVTP